MSEWIQVFKYVQIQEQITWYQITRYRMIQQIYSLQCLQVAREMQESQLQNVSTCYKQIRKDMNTHEQTNDISSYSHHQILISERWELRRRPSTSASRIISSTSSSVSFSSAEWYTHTSHSFCTPHGKSLHISRKFTYCIASYDISLRVWHSRAWYWHGQGLEV